MSARRRVAVVGAGGIADIHVEILRGMPTLEIAAVVDRERGRAEALACKAGGVLVLEDARELVARKLCDAAHVLVPPGAHRSVAVPLLEAGIHVLVEKPMAPGVQECDAMIAAARAGGACLGVNHNLLHNVAFLELERAIRANELGALRHVHAAWSVPLGPLQTRQFGQWMFQRPHNLVVEQGVHPLSMVLRLAGEPLEVQCLPAPPVNLTEGLEFIDTWLVSMRFARCTAQVFLSFGQPMSAVSLTAICEDGVASADLENKRVLRTERSRFELLGRFAGGVRQARALRGQNLREFLDTALHPLGLRDDPAPFFLSMRGSLAAFHAGIGMGDPLAGARFGRSVVATCESITRTIASAPPPAAAASPAREVASASAAPSPTCDVALIGGTGVIGRLLVERLTACGKRVRVMARNTARLDDVFRRALVDVVAGNAEAERDVAALVKGARAVVDLYYPKEGADVDRRMLEAAERTARACLEAGVSRLVYLSSTAALYLGRRGEVITGATPPDPRGEKRPPYARGKGLAERRLNELHRSEGLSVCILRPGIVVGEGGAALHPGLGRFINPQHCIGFNDGSVPMAFVLVEDVACAIVLAVDSKTAGGKTYNVVGDVRLTAREYVEELARAFARPLRFHPKSLALDQASEVGKWLLKRAAGRRDARMQSLRDARSRAMYATIDTTDIQRDLGWRPVADRAEFVRRAIGVHVEPR
jgi:predicted dehydrogenase/nucleoside-diphosphate-sugar epimerase